MSEENQPARLPELPSPDTHIRLLTLLPTDAAATAEEQFASPIACRVFVAPIVGGPDRPVFKTLSYRWGTGGRDHAINVGGGVLAVTASIVEALRYLRCADGPLTLWIDQICIDQENDREKSHQVGLMDRIYTAAEEVVVWLGAAADDSDAVMDLWADVGCAFMGQDVENSLPQIFPQLPITMGRAQGPVDEVTTRLMELVRPTWSKTEPLLPAIADWLQRPWFQRVWIVQEFALNARTVFVCGTKRVEAEMAARALYVCKWAVVLVENDEKSRQREDLLPTDPTTALFSIRRRRRDLDDGEAKGDTMFEILRRLYIGQNMQVTDPRDRIYAVLGLAVDREAMGIAPDYEDTGTEQLLVRTARALVERGGRLDALCFAQRPRTHENLPTWVPEWTGASESYYNAEDFQERRFAACGSLQVTVVPTDSDRILGLRGFTVDRIEEVEDIWEGKHHDTTRVASYLTQVKRLCALSAGKDEPIYASPERRAEAVWRVPIGDLCLIDDGVRVGRAGVDVAHQHANCVDLYELLAQARSMPPGEILELMPQIWFAIEAAKNYSSSAADMRGKRPFLTRRGYVGMAPEAARLGDVVVVFCGGQIPFVLRPVEEGMFTFVGEAYCDGIMDGELVSSGVEETFLLM